jgi:hypothetical protein
MTAKTCARNLRVIQKVVAPSNGSFKKNDDRLCTKSSFLLFVSFFTASVVARIIFHQFLESDILVALLGVTVAVIVGCSVTLLYMRKLEEEQRFTGVPNYCLSPDEAIVENQVPDTSTNQDAREMA